MEAGKGSAYTQTNSFLEDAGLMSEMQFDFRKNHSTQQAIAQPLNHVDFNLNRKMKTVTLYIDFKKAFDCLQYTVLLRKLELLHMGFDTLNWIKDYLTDRKQSTYANGVTSPPSGVRQGVHPRPTTLYYLC